jgi:hypothetical protein
MDGIISLDFMDRTCNCNHASKIDGKCSHNGECRKMCVIYKATCKRFAISPTLDKHNKNLRIAWASIFFKMSRN